jgi:hypothetical protein
MIAESKTLTPRVLDMIEGLGFKIVERGFHLAEARSNNER